MRVSIYVEGGIVQVVYADEPCEVEVVDFDKHAAEPISVSSHDVETPTFDPFAMALLRAPAWAREDYRKSQEATS